MIVLVSDKVLPFLPSSTPVERDSKAFAKPTEVTNHSVSSIPVNTIAENPVTPPRSSIHPKSAMTPKTVPPKPTMTPKTAPPKPTMTPKTAPPKPTITPKTVPPKPTMTPKTAPLKPERNSRSSIVSKSSTVSKPVVRSTASRPSFPGQPVLHSMPISRPKHASEPATPSVLVSKPVAKPHPKPIPKPTSKPTSKTSNTTSTQPLSLIADIIARHTMSDGDVTRPTRRRKKQVTFSIDSPVVLAPREFSPDTSTTLLEAEPLSAPTILIPPTPRQRERKAQPTVQNATEVTQSSSTKEPPAPSVTCPSDLLHGKH